MTREEIEDIPKIVNYLLDGGVIDSTKTKLNKRLKEVCDLAIEALEQEPCEDAISRQAAVNIASGFCHPANIADELAKLPSVNPQEPKTEWIPVTFRPMTDEEKKDYAERTGFDEEDLDTMLNCKLPEDGETVLITDCLGNVEVDTFIYDCEGCYFECNCEMEDVKAWMPLPLPFEPQESEGAE